MNLLPKTLFGRAAATLLLAFLAFEAIAFALVWHWVILPLSQRSADDLAAKIVLAAKTWVELPPVTRADYEMELSFRHDLELGEAKTSLPVQAHSGFFSGLTQTALSRRAQQSVHLLSGPDPDWDWLELKVADKRLRIGFDRERYALRAPLAALGIFLLGAALTALTALLLVRQTSRRLQKLAEFADEVGQGRAPAHLPETGARELQALTAAFNHMAGEVQAHLENRTVLLSGISHDLRTPITRLRLALSMLDDVDHSMVARMERDLEDMNRLITDMLGFARGLRSDEARDCDLAVLLADLAAQAAQLGPVIWQSPGPCLKRVGEAALRRIVTNLLDNARRYGGEAPITLELQCTANGARIGVLDCGPGIPAEHREAVFRPFYRLEESRSREGGGSGLGLAIVAQLASAYGWQVSLTEREGGGLAAWVELRNNPDT